MMHKYNIGFPQAEMVTCYSRIGALSRCSGPAILNINTTQFHENTAVVESKLRGVVWCCVVLLGVVWCCVVLCGVAWCCVVLCGVVWCCVVLCGVVW